MIRTLFIVTWAATAAILLPVSLSAVAHEGHDHGAATKPTDVRLFPRFEIRSGDIEVVGVLAGKNLVIYLDRADDNAPIQGAQIEIEGQDLQGIATPMAEGVYQLPAAPLTQPGHHPLTLTVQAGDIVDLLSADLEVEEAPAAVAPPHSRTKPKWWLIAGIPLFLLVAGGLIARRLRHEPKLGA